MLEVFFVFDMFLEIEKRKKIISIKILFIKERITIILDFYPIEYIERITEEKKKKIFLLSILFDKVKIF